MALSCASALSPSVVAAETLPPAKLHGARAPHHLVHGSVVPLAAGQAPNAAVPPFSWITQLFPSVKPYPPGQGGADHRDPTVGRVRSSLDDAGALESLDELSHSRLRHTAQFCQLG